MGASVVTEHEGRPVGWPRVAVSVDYKSPARFGDLLEINVQVARKGTTSMTYRFAFSCDGRELATGEMTSVCCLLEPGKPPRPIEIPAPLAARLDGALDAEG